MNHHIFNHHILKVILALIVISSAMSVKATPQTAQSSYAKGDYAAAISEMESLQHSQGVSASLYYDLGNAYYKSGNMGAAVLNYEKALRLAPGYKDARGNLEYVQNLVRIKNEEQTEGTNMDPAPAQPGIMQSMSLSISHVSSDTYAWIAFAIFVLAAGSWALYLFAERVLMRKIGFFAGIALPVLSVAMVICAVVSKRASMRIDECVLQTDMLSLRQSPTEQSEQVCTPLTAGTVLKVLDHATDSGGTNWTHVYLNAEYSGWVPSEDVAVISVAAINE